MQVARAPRSPRGPIHPRLTQALPGLDIAYRASDAPQIVDVRIRTAGPSELPYAAWAVAGLVAAINAGAAAGAEFAPATSRAAILEGPTGEDGKGLGTDSSFKLEIAGVAPSFVRTFVEQMAIAGTPHELTGLTFVGSAPTDISALTVRDGDVRTWLGDPDAYPAATAALPFTLRETRAPRGASVKITLRDAAPKDVGAAFGDAISAWQNAVLTHPNLGGTARGFMSPQATFGRTRTDLLAHFSLFDHRRAPVRAALLNVLGRFHTTVARVTDVELALPG